MRSTRISCLAVMFTLVAAVMAQAEEAKYKVFAKGLDNPCAVAVQPSKGHVFVSDSAAGRVVRYVNGKQEDVVTDFPQDVYGKGPKYNIGPLGLAFYDKDTLVVGGGGVPDGQELLRVYDVPEAGMSIKADAMKHKVGPWAAGESSIKGEGNFYGVAIANKHIYLTCNGDDTKGWVGRVSMKDPSPTKIEPFLETKVATEVDAPVGITISPADGYIVIGQMGEISVPGDSLLTFYHPVSKKLLMNLPTGLSDIAGLAYSPKTGLLYAVDFSWNDTSKGGLFRLDQAVKDGKQVVDAVRIATLDKPSSLGFSPNGDLFVTVFGSAEEGSSEKPGKVLLFDSKSLVK